MAWILFAGIFVFGLIAGSFLNVCIYRMPAEKSLVSPGSFCPACKKPIRWFDNVPLLSYFILGGRCRDCKARISVQYPAVELITGLMLLWLAWETVRAGESAAVLAVRVFVTLGLIAVAFVDARHQIIPDEVSLMGIPAAFFASLFVPRLHAGVWPFGGMFPDGPAPASAALSSLAGIAAGGGSLWLVGVLGKLILKKEAMGLGDVKLMAMVGGFIGWINVLIAIFIACGIGSVVGVAVLIRTKSRRIAFGPFLAAGTFLMLLYSPAIIYFLTDTYPRFIRGILNLDN